MPDVSRSDSNRSDASRPRVSFNRDVHVKRINGPRTANAYSLSPDGTGFVPTVVRRESRPKTKRQITKEAEAVLKQADKISCKPVQDPKMDPDEKPEPKKKRKDSFLSKFSRNGSSDLDSGSSSQEYRVYKVNERKIDKARDFASLDRKKFKKEKKNQNLEYLSLEQQNGKETKPKPKISCQIPSDDKKKKQLSPIIESPGTDYFDAKKNSKIGRMVKHLTEKSGARVKKPPPATGTTCLKAPGEDRTHNDNKPFSYTENNKKEESESLDGKEDSESTSPTNDVIYAQVVVSGRDGNVQKTTVHARIASNEVGRNLVGEPDRSRVGLDYKIESNREDGIYETLPNGDNEMWKRKSDFLGKKEKFESFGSSPQSELYGENPGRRDLYRRKSIEDRKTPSPLYDEGPRIRVASKYDPLIRRNRINRPESPTDLRDLSIRREILLSRSESLAKERYNSLKRLREPVRIKKRTSTDDYRYLGNDIRVNDTFATSLRKIPKDVELIRPVRTKRDSGSDSSYLKEKQQIWKSNEKLHTLKSGNENNLLNKLTKIGKSKSFIEEKGPRLRKMEKVKSLFRKKKDGKGSESEDDPLSSRYIEYRGSDLDLSDGHPEDAYPGRKRLPTPASSRNSYDSMGTLTQIKNNKNKESHWLKTLTKKGKHKFGGDDGASELSKPSNLRFFGDTDQESTTNEPEIDRLKSKYGLHRGEKIFIDSDDEPPSVVRTPSRSESRMTDSTLKGSGKYKSKYDLDRPDYGLKQMNYTLNIDTEKDYLGSNLSDTSTLKNGHYDFDLNGMRYGPNISRSMSSVTNSSRYEPKEKLRNLKSTPIITVTRPEESLSRRVRSHGNLYIRDDLGRARRRIYDSSAESTTEGDSSQHSAKSMIYLHAATVGDIPGPRNIYKSERRSQSREELSSIGDGSTTVLTPNKKTLSRSISVLAPWRPKHYKEDRSLHYDSGNGSDFGRGKPPTGPLKTNRSLSRERKPGELRFNTLGKENRRQKDLLR